MMQTKRVARGGDRARGIAMGLLGVLIMAFFAILFSLGRYSLLGHDENSLDHDPRDEAAAAKNESWDKKWTTTISLGQQNGGLDQVKELIKKSPAITKQEEVVEKIDPSPPPPPAVKKDVATVVDKKKDEEGLSALDAQYKPTREMVQKIQQNGYLCVTWANWHYQDFVMTWVAHVRKVNITGYIVGAMDDHLLQVLIDKKINTFSMKSGLTTGDFGWGSKTFAKMGREKIRLISIFLRLGVQVIIADVDVLWLRNPLPFFDRYQEADLLTSSDHLSSTVDNESLEKWPDAASAANIGIMLFREKSLGFVDEWIKIIESDETVWDQNAFNSLFRVEVKLLADDPKHYFLGYHGQLKMGILPVALFASGHTFFTQSMYKTLNLQPYAVHATFQFSGTPGKRHRMRELSLFEDPDTYYDHKTGFVSFDMDGVQELLGKAGPLTGNMDLGNVQGHFKLVNHQILRIRAALAIASVLGRVIVVPEVWCGLDRWWAPHSGVIPGSSFKLPFKCPLDHIFDLEGGWHRPLPIDHGPDIDYRESSFFSNPRMTDAVNKSRVTIELCAPGDSKCSDGSSPAALEGGNKLRIQQGLLSENLKVALTNANSFKVLHFTSMSGAFKNFTNEGDWVKFASRMRIYGSIWCCINAHPGHIHYDLLFDLPHVDKFGRKWNGSDWEPKTGP